MDDFPVLLSREDAIKLIGSFFSKEWSHLKTDEVTVDRIPAGNNNVIYIVSSTKVVKEPGKLVIRKYGGRHPTYKVVLDHCSEMEELVICCQLASQGLAPKIYGIFPGGRIEEYIDSTRPQKEDSDKPDFQIDLAKNFARFHAADLPLPKPKYNYYDMLKDAKEKCMNSVHEILSNADMSEVHQFLSTDWDNELEFLKPLLDPHRHRIVFILWGGHFANIGLINNPKEGQLKSFLFDYEMCCYSIRGRDLGHHLCSKNGYGPVSVDFPNDEHSNNFLIQYMQECEKLFEDWNPNSLDSLDHIIMESFIGAMVSSFEWMSSSINHYKTTFEEHGASRTVGGITRRIRMYYRYKAELMSRYPDFQKRL